MSEESWIEIWSIQLFFVSLHHNKTIKNMAKELTRNGIVGLELTREETVDLRYQVRALQRKAQCREVNCDIIDMFNEVWEKLLNIENELTDIIETDE